MSLKYLAFALAVIVVGSIFAHAVLIRKKVSQNTVLSSTSVTPTVDSRRTFTSPIPLASSVPVVSTQSEAITTPYAAAGFTAQNTPTPKAMPKSFAGTLVGNSFSLHDNNDEYYTGILTGSSVFLNGKGGTSMTGTFSSTSIISIYSASSTCSGNAIYTTVSLTCSDGNSLSGSLIGSQFFLNDLKGGHYYGSIEGSQVFLNDTQYSYFGSEIPAQYFTGTYSVSGALILRGFGSSFVGRVTDGNVELAKD